MYSTVFGYYTNIIFNIKMSLTTLTTLTDKIIKILVKKGLLNYYLFINI